MDTAELMLTKADIIGRLKTDPYFGLNFALDNNFPDLKTKLAEKGIAVDTPDQARERILILARNGRAQDIRDIFNVPYIDTATNGTGGYAEFFVQNSPPPPNPATGGTEDGGGLRTMTWSSVWTGVLSFIGGGLTGLAAGASGAGPSAADAAAAEAAAKAEEERKKRVMWTWIAVIGGLIVLGTAAYFIFRKKKGSGS